MDESQLNTRVPSELKKNIKVIAARENTTVEEIIIKQLEEYVKVHGEGNPVYALDKWVDEPNFKAVPALLEKPDKWMEFLQNCDEQLRQDIHGQMWGLIQGMKKRGLI